MKLLVLFLFCFSEFSYGFYYSDSRISSKPPEPHPVFSYDKNDEYSPENWWKVSKNCAGSNQSPVNLQEKISVPVKNPLKIIGLDKKPDAIKIINNGHAAGMKFIFKVGEIFFVGGPLSVPYILRNVHWHWGESDRGGSEHHLNGKSYDAEVHLVAFSSAYKTLTEAVTQPKGVAVLGIFYKLDNNQTNQIPYVNFIPGVIEPKTDYETNKNLFTLRDLIKTEDFQVLSYNGSLTTPGCYETVTWMVSTTPLSISSADLAEFRKIKDDKGKPILKNFRPIQRFGFRNLTRYY